MSTCNFRMSLTVRTPVYLTLGLMLGATLVLLSACAVPNRIPDQAELDRNKRAEKHCMGDNCVQWYTQTRGPYDAAIEAHAIRTREWHECIRSHHVKEC